MTQPPLSTNPEPDKKAYESAASAADSPPVDTPAADSSTQESPAATEQADKSSPTADEVQFAWGDGLSLDVSAIHMSVRLEIAAQFSTAYTAQDLARFLQEKNIVYGVEENALQEIFDKNLFNQPVGVAKGKQPESGKDGYVEWLVDLSILEGAKLVEHRGRVDWKERHHVLQVSENQLIARLIPPTEGEPGCTVYGKEIPVKAGREARFPVGKGVRIGEDVRELYSCLDGVVCWNNNKITVSPTYTVQGDINLKTGNVNYDETVVISGGVLTDFTVKAGEDIHIHGLVEGAHIEAAGSIYINGGVQGDQKAHLKAGADISVKFINNATVEAAGDIIVSGSIVNSLVRAGGRVIVEGAKAIIVGGEIQAEKEIAAAILGSELGVKTKLELGVELKQKIADRNDHSKQIESLLANYKKLQLATDQLNILRDKGKLNPEQSALRLKIIRGGLQVQAQIKQMREEQRLVNEYIENYQKELVGVSARQVAYPGVQIMVMGKQFLVKTITSKAVFALIKNEVDVLAYKEPEEKKEKKGKKDPKEEKHEAGISEEEKKKAASDAIAKIRSDSPGAK